MLFKNEVDEILWEIEQACDYAEKHPEQKVINVKIPAPKL